MYYLQVKSLSHKYGQRSILSDIDFSIEQGQKVALVARNGMGKSTLLDLLVGKIECLHGEIIRNKNIRVWFLSQKFLVDESIIVREWLYQDTMSDEEYQERDHMTKVKKIINRLKLSHHLDQTIGSLSGGEQKRLFLAKVLMDEPDMLLLDEPTNHLDIEMIEWLEKFLRKSTMTLLMVTHDRYFLQRVCTQIIELDRGNLHFYDGNYSIYLNKKSERLEKEQRDTHIMKQLYRRELAWVKKDPRGRQSKSRKRSQDFFQLQDQYYDKKNSLAQSIKKIDIARSDKDDWIALGNKIIVLSHIFKSFDTKVIVSDFSHDFRQGERIGILGKNGVWKSTFLNILTDSIDIDKGRIERADTLRIGYYSQHMTFPQHIKVIDYAKSIADWMMIGKEKISTPKLLERFLFTPAQQQSWVHDLSGGEQRRLFLLTILMSNPNFLILDEPTNDLDLDTLTALEDFLSSYQWCLIVISHDRYFIDKIADRIFFFAGEGKIVNFEWWYSMFTQWYDKTKKTDLVVNKDKAILMHDASQESLIPPKRTLTYNEKREFEWLIDEIAKWESRKDEINTIFQTQQLSHEEIKLLGKELQELVTDLQTKEERRLLLSERV